MQRKQIYKGIAVFFLALVLVACLAPTKQVHAAEADENGFIIENGVLTGYVGTSTQIVIPESVTEIADHVFYFSGVEEVVMPSKIKKIGNAAFAFSAVKKVTFQGAADGAVIGSYAFSESYFLESINIPVGVTVVEEGAFSGCLYTQEITLPQGLEKIGRYAFYECTQVKNKVKIPSSVTEIGAYAFWKCRSAEFEFPTSGLISIGTKAFCECRSIGSRVELPSGLQKIGGKAFAFSGLDDVIIPKSVTYIGGGAFSDTAITIHCEKNSYAYQYAKIFRLNTYTSKVQLTQKSITIAKGQSTSVVEALLWNGEKIKSWKSSDKKVATVNGKGKITGKKAGTATITVTTKSGDKAIVKVKVQAKKVQAEKMTLNDYNVTLKPGKTFQLKVQMSPITATSKLKYSSSNTSVATVSSKGKIKAKKKGYAIIRIEAENGLFVLCAVNVQ